MLVLHQLGDCKIQKEIAEKNPQLILTNRRGDFFYWRDDPSSRYQGFYFREGDAVYKAIAQLPLGVSLPIKRIKNYFWGFEVERSSGLTERFFMDTHSHSLIYELNNPIAFNLILDCKEIFDNNSEGRFYEISEEDGCVVVSFVKKNQSGAEQSGYFLAVAGNNFSWKKCSEWRRQKYEYDAARRDPPGERYVFKAAEFSGSEFVFSADFDKEKAKSAARKTLKEKERIKQVLRDQAADFAFADNLRFDNEETRIAYLAAKFSLRGLTVRGDDGRPTGAYAGIPWFAQTWFRDFSLFVPQMELDAAKAVFLKYLEQYSTSGVIKPVDGIDSPIAYADTEGLFFKAADDLYDKKLLTRPETAAVKSLLLRYVDEVLPAKMKDGFLSNGPKETWMDTVYRDPGRAGARIEIQALVLRTLRFAYILTKDHKYTDREYEFLKSVRARFWNGKDLTDGLDDPVLRPNLFLAYYIYDNLLLPHEWSAAFESALRALWLPWGGLASLDKNHENFCGVYRGCDDPNRSYHHGDSWFFLNNIVALAMHSVGLKKFKDQIAAILEASAKDILWSGALGHHSELSSAEDFSPGGCMAQGWSAACFAEAAGRIKGII